jgi:phytoene desaturase
MPTDKAIVIGAGIGGIATAIRLASKGYEVEVHEKNEVPGGKLYLIEKEGYRFDAGPSLFTQPANIEELFHLAGEDIRSYFAYQKVDIACRYFFENGKILNAHTHAPSFANEMEKVLGEPANNVLQYLKDAERVYENVGTIFLNHSLHKISTWLHPRVLTALKTIRWKYMFWTLDQFNHGRFSTAEAVQIFNRFATYNGSNPYRAPGMLSLIPHLEQNQGTFYPRGGMISIPNALIRLAEKKGVRFVLKSRVERIVTEGGFTKGIIANGVFSKANAVVSNVDAYYTYKDLLADNAAASHILRNERSSSALIFYWGMRESFPELHLHNIFFSKNYREEFDHLFKEKKFYEDPTVYVNITSKMEPAQAPEGCENWFVMVNAPAIAEADWQKETDALKRNVITKLSSILGRDIGAAIQVEEVITPAGIQSRTDSYLGSLYGTSSNSKWAAFLRHPNSSRSLKGLYFTGGSVHPGGGIPLCLKSAAIVSNMIPSPQNKAK